MRIQKKKASGVLCTIMITLIISIQGCISEYIPKDIMELEDMLVVESTITNNTTHVRLTRSSKLNKLINKSKNIENAEVYVETKDGSYTGQGVHIVDGNYTIETGDLNPTAQYRLYLKIGNKEYASDYLSPVITPEIDSISWRRNGSDQPVYICVSTHGTEEQSPYYRWAYKEHWEMKTELKADGTFITRNIAGYIVDEFIPFDFDSSNNTYYCWGKDSAKILILDSSEKMETNIIPQKKLVEIDPSGDKLSILYYIRVKQTSLRKEAYYYLLNTQKNIEQTGGLFSSMPVETKGNIRCLSNTDIPVIGYVDVATTTEKEHFIPESAGAYVPPLALCRSLVTLDGGFKDALLFIYAPGNPTVVLWAPGYCVNCLLKDNASKDKPAWWPTSHL